MVEKCRTGMVLVPRQTLQKVVDYLWEDEKRNFEEVMGSSEISCDQAARVRNHIFTHVNRLQEALQGRGKSTTSRER